MEFVFFLNAIVTEICNYFGVVDGTVARICRPVLNERVVYNGHPRVHGVKIQSVVLPNGSIINLEGQWQGLRHDCTMLYESGVLNQLYRLA